MSWLEHVPLFLLGVSSLLPLFNPLGAALIIDPYFETLDQSHRKTYSFKIVSYSLILGLCALYFGSWCLKFMGVSIPTTQIAGGIVIAKLGLGLLNAKRSEEALARGPTDKVENSLFYPLAFPLTLGPGCISTLIALSAHASSPAPKDTMMHLTAISLALIVVCAITYVCFVYSHLILRRIGPSGTLVVNRLLAFLVFCIGIQMVATGLSHLFPKILS